VLQSGEYSRLGGTSIVKADSWVITSTNHELEKDIKQGLFREDLYYRLNIIKIELPPLRDRKEDIPLLIDHMIKKNQAELGIDGQFFISLDMRRFFQDYPWPGNVRELSSVILRLMVGDDPESIKAELTRNLESGSPVSTGDAGEGQAQVNEKARSLKALKYSAIRHVEKKAIFHALETCRWNKTDAARLLKISYKTLFTKMHELGIEK